MKKLKRAQHLSWKELGNHTIILDSTSEQKVHHLDEVGTYIWKTIDGEKSRDDILGSICDEFDVSREVALSDFNSFVELLESEKLLEPEA